MLQVGETGSLHSLVLQANFVPSLGDALFSIWYVHNAMVVPWNSHSLVLVRLRLSLPVHSRCVVLREGDRKVVRYMLRLIILRLMMFVVVNASQTKVFSLLLEFRVRLLMFGF
jgi:hypothetical protein